MEDRHCVLFNISSTIKQEFIQEEGDLSDEGIVSEEEFVLGDWQCEQRLDKCDPLLINNVIMDKDVSEESNIMPIMKEELILENEDIWKECTSQQEDVTQQGVCYRTNGSKQLKAGLSEAKFDSQKYQCGVCNKVFTQKSYLSKHKLIHNSVKKFKCDICNKSFADYSYLSKHKLIHSGIRRYQCEVCNKSFIQNSTLSRHKAIHSRIKKYQCEVCNKAFTENRTLKTHKLIHSRKKNNKCEVCNKAFTNMFSWSRHNFIVHSS